MWEKWDLLVFKDTDLWDDSFSMIRLLQLLKNEWSWCALRSCLSRFDDCTVKTCSTSAPCHSVFSFVKDPDQKPKSEQPAAAAGAPGGAAAEPSTSQPPKTEETTQKTSDPLEESKVRDDFSSPCWQHVCHWNEESGDLIRWVQRLHSSTHVKINTHTFLYPSSCCQEKRIKLSRKLIKILQHLYPADRLRVWESEALECSRMLITLRRLGNKKHVKTGFVSPWIWTD